MKESQANGLCRLCNNVNPNWRRITCKKGYLQGQMRMQCPEFVEATISLDDFESLRSKIEQEIRQELLNGKA